MATQISPIAFNFNSHEIRTFTDEKQNPWFLANDICIVLGYRNPSKTISDHCKEGGITKRYTPTSSGSQSMTYINEGNLYRLIVKSKKPEAEKFEVWVFEEVLPTIRKTGTYSQQQPVQWCKPTVLTFKSYTIRMIIDERQQPWFDKAANL